MFKVLDLFSGIGGFSLGLEATGAFRTIAFCEQDRFCQAVLRKHWPGIPIHPDVKTFDFQGECDVITGGYPCTPFSVAGKQKGFEDDRHLWPHMFEIVAQKKPSWVICENVYGHISMGVDQVLLDLASQNYTCLPFVVGACAVNAPHRRQRVFIIARKNVANPDDPRNRTSRHGTVQDGQKTNEGREEQSQPQLGRLGQNVADAQSAGLEGRGVSGNAGKEQSRFGQGSRPISNSWLTEPDVGRVAHGVPNRAYRLKALGNAVVPQIVTQIGKAIIAAEQQ